MDFEPNCQTTAMSVMPHRDAKKALELALGLDIPFWPQLPRISFSEDMFAQLADGFPGTSVDFEEKRVIFDTAKFMEDLEEYSALMGNTMTYEMGEMDSMTFPSFMNTGLNGHQAIRGQVCGPVNFGFRVADEEKRPLIYNDDVRMLLFDFVQRRVNAQYHELVKKNSNAFVWVDEPGLGWVFSSFSGYNDVQAREDYQSFMAGMEGPRALHLCLNVNLPYLLELGLDILSIDVFQLDVMPRVYASDTAAFLKSGGIISWGIVPTESVTLDPQTPQTLFERLTGYWKVIADSSDISMEQIARQALIAPSKCCIRNAVMTNIDDELPQLTDYCQPAEIEESLVERAFSYLPEISGMLKERFGL